MFVNQKAQEISYAVVRIAPYIRRTELRQRIEKLAFQLLEDVSLQGFEFAIKTTAALENLINLGKSIYEVEPVNAKIIIGELKSLESAMRQIVGLDPEGGATPDMGVFFSKVPAIISEENNQEQMRQDSVAEVGNGNISGNGIVSTMRQSAILEKIRQSENRQSQLKDLISAFPDVSERTMRYDLQKLCSQGLIERIGNGGPGSYYTLK